MIKFSVIVPVYNVEKYIDKCLNCLVNQTYKNIEIIVVNDGSPDNSQKIIDKYVNKYDNVKSYIKKNGGLSDARNFGLKYAQGEYISFIDSDDYVSKNMFKVINDSISNKDYDLIYFDYTVVSSKYKKLFNKEFYCIDNENVSDIEYLFSDPCAWNKIYKRKFLKDVEFQFPKGIIYEDYCSTPTLIKHNPKIMHIDKCLYYYVFSDYSITRGSEYKEKYEDLLKATDILYDNFKDTNYLYEIEFIIYYNCLYLGALNFYKYEKYDIIDKISNFMRKNFPNWIHNKYIIKRDKKERILAYLFYIKKYKLIRFVQNIKKLVKHEK